MHKNIITNAQKVHDTYHSSYLEDFDIGGNDIQYPFSTLKLFNSEDIIKSLLK